MKGYFTLPTLHGRWKAESGGGAVGNAPIGSGNGGEATPLSYGAGQKPRTTYFRKGFTVDNPSRFSELGVSLDFSASDGAIVYLNGVEFLHHNLPDTGVTYQTKGNGQEQTRPVVASAPATLLRPGVTNELAVEVHRSAPADPGFRFDLSLSGVRKSSLAQALIPAGSEWQYNDQLTADPPSSWKTQSGGGQWRLRERGVPGPDRHPRVNRDRQRGGCPVRSAPGLPPGAAGNGKGISAGEGCCRRGAEGRGFCLPLWSQYRTGGECPFGR